MVKVGIPVLNTGSMDKVKPALNAGSMDKVKPALNAGTMDKVIQKIIN